MLTTNASRTLKISNLIRPFNERIARQVLERSGILVSLIRPLKKPQFESEEQAANALADINGKVFPPDIGSVVAVCFISDSDTEAVIEHETKGTPLPSSFSSSGSVANSSRMGSVVAVEHKKVDSMGRELFKTKAEPVILYSYAQ
ncbi:UNVERIFIED_CONTAM: hypothetical protein HDU68_004808 [Siphonaria sp. JEL0065]|nr:hypothetical protein HDU68_004808 [Siphonaria sp. JEL0065]